MNNDNILSLDLGTSFIKGFLVDNHLNIKREQSIEIKTIIYQQIHEQDPYEILSAVKHILKTIIENDQVDKIVFTNAMHSTLLLNENKEPLTNSIIWSDMRAADVYTDFSKKIDPIRFYNITKVPLHPILPILKLYWVKEQNVELWEKAFFYCSLKDWIIYKLTGEFVTDVSTAASFGLMNFKESEWDIDLLDICQISSDDLPIIYNGSFKISADKYSIIIGNTDGPMANYFVNTTNSFSNTLVVTAGTSAAVRTISTTTPKEIDPVSGIFTYTIKDDLFASGIASNNAGSVLKWAEMNLDFHYLDNEITVPPDIDEPIFNPFIYGERAPLWNIEHKESLVSLSDLSSDKISFLVYEAVFFNILRMIESLEFLGNTDEVVVSGGVLAERSAAQLFANIIQKKVIVLESIQLSALGSAKFGLEQFGYTFEKQNLNSETLHPDKNWKYIENTRYIRFKEFIK